MTCHTNQHSPSTTGTSDFRWFMGANTCIMRGSKHAILHHPRLAVIWPISANLHVTHLICLSLQKAGTRQTSYAPRTVIYCKKGYLLLNSPAALLSAPFWTSISAMSLAPRAHAQYRGVWPRESRASMSAELPSSRAATGRPSKVLHALCSACLPAPIKVQLS